MTNQLNEAIDIEKYLDFSFRELLELAAQGVKAVDKEVAAAEAQVAACSAVASRIATAIGELDTKLNIPEPAAEDYYAASDYNEAVWKFRTWTANERPELQAEYDAAHADYMRSVEMITAAQAALQAVQGRRQEALRLAQQSLQLELERAARLVPAHLKDVA